jgi:hypothetical protein
MDLLAVTIRDVGGNVLRSTRVHVATLQPLRQASKNSNVPITARTDAARPIELRPTEPVFIARSFGEQQSLGTK